LGSYRALITLDTHGSNRAGRGEHRGANETGGDSRDPNAATANVKDTATRRSSLLIRSSGVISGGSLLDVISSDALSVGSQSVVMPAECGLRPTTRAGK
jgi:hypothetical protein